MVDFLGMVFVQGLFLVRVWCLGLCATQALTYSLLWGVGGNGGVLRSELANLINQVGKKVSVKLHFA